METYAIEYIFNHIHRLYSENPKGDYGYIKIYLKSKKAEITLCFFYNNY